MLFYNINICLILRNKCDNATLAGRALACSYLETALIAAGIARVREVMTHRVISKPPNVLLYQPEKDTTSLEYLRVKKSLERCLTPECYTIYPLGEEDILKDFPWKDNCRLLVLPPVTESVPCVSDNLIGQLPSRVIEKFLTFLQSGGTILSLHPHLNQFLGLPPLKTSPPPAQDGELRGGNADAGTEDEGMVEVCLEGGDVFQFSCLVSNTLNKKYDSEDVYLDSPLSNFILGGENLSFFLPKMNCEEDNINSSDKRNLFKLSPIRSGDQSPHGTKIPCIRKINFTNNGCAVISSFDFLPVLQTGMELELQLNLSQGVPYRKQLLISLLRGLGLECSEGKPPEITSTYLLCSDKVRLLACTCHVTSYNITPSLHVRAEGGMKTNTSMCVIDHTHSTHSKV